MFVQDHNNWTDLLLSQVQMMKRVKTETTVQGQEILSDSIQQQQQLQQQLQQQQLQQLQQQQLRQQQQNYLVMKEENSNSEEVLERGSEADESEMEEENSSDEDDEAASEHGSGQSQSGFLAEYMTSSSKAEKRYFWQYNTQAKGPKGKRLCKSVRSEDPHVLNDFEDPVFDPEQNQTKYKHSGKARRGDGNDVTPNAYKLFLTGNELRKLNKLINGIAPTSELSPPARSKSLKEKNKYASRACRLKKKAQHEANKLKLYGLEQEHRQLMKVLTSIKREILVKFNSPHTAMTNGQRMTNKLESLMKAHLTMMIAGHTADYVNTVLQRVAEGDRSGGLSVDE